MRKGCIGAVAALALIVLVLGYVGYRYLTTVLEVPEDLARYNDPLEAAALIRDTTPAPPDTAHFTATDLERYLGGLDSVAAGWQPLVRAFDSLILVSRNDASDTTLSLANAPNVLRQLAIFGPRTHRAIVHYLNDQRLSLARYIWIRDRVIAASGVTDHEVRQAAERTLRHGLSFPFGADLQRDLFARVEKLRVTGRIDSTEHALARPHRDELLERGLFSLMNLEGTLTRPSARHLNISID